MVAQLGEDYTSATISSRQSRSVLFSGYRTGEAKRRACNPSSLDDYVGTAEVAREHVSGMSFAHYGTAFGCSMQVELRIRSKPGGQLNGHKEEQSR